MTDRGRPLEPDFFSRPAVEVARDLVGVSLGYGDAAGVIVETEAYAGDAASHFVTRPRTARMMGDTWGRVYLYRIYGIHRCLNFTADATGPGGVLIRAVEPTDGLEAMHRRRGVDRLRDLANGPAKLYVALGVDWEIRGDPVLDHFDLRLPRSPPKLDVGPRVGISAARDLPWRFRLAGSPCAGRAR